MLCVDEKSQIQALDRTAPTLPSAGHPGARDHDYERTAPPACTRANVQSGEVIGTLHQRHRAVEFLKFLKTIDQNVPAHLDVHLVLDNASSHKTPTVRRWLAQHPRFVLHFTPTSSSWINLVERWSPSSPPSCYAVALTAPSERSTPTSDTGSIPGTKTPARRVDQDRRPDPRLDQTHCQRKQRDTSRLTTVTA